MDNEKFAAAVKKYRAQMYKTAFCYTKNSADAEDVTEDAFLKLLQRREGFDSEESEKAWLLRVTINCAKDLLKSRWYRFREPVSEELPAPEREENELLDTVMKLPKRYRTVLFLFYYEGYPVKETAELLGISKSAVTTRLARGRALLKARLEAVQNDERGCNYVQKNI